MLSKQAHSSKWGGGGVMGAKAQAKIEKRRKALENAIKV
jgi:hypothetical protein